MHLIGKYDPILVVFDQYSPKNIIIHLTGGIHKFDVNVLIVCPFTTEGIKLNSEELDNYVVQIN